MLTGVEISNNWWFVAGNTEIRATGAPRGEIKCGLADRAWSEIAGMSAGFGSDMTFPADNKFGFVHGCGPVTEDILGDSNIITKVAVITLATDVINYMISDLNRGSCRRATSYGKDKRIGAQICWREIY